MDVWDNHLRACGDTHEKFNAFVFVGVASFCAGVVLTLASDAQPFLPMALIFSAAYLIPTALSSLLLSPLAKDIITTSKRPAWSSYVIAGALIGLLPSLILFAVPLFLDARILGLIGLNALSGAVAGFCCWLVAGRPKAETPSRIVSP